MKVSFQKQPAEKKVLALQELIKNATKIANKNVKVPGEHISNSFLSMIEKEITGKNQFYGSERHLIFGHELHKRILQPWKKRKILSKEEELLLTAMSKVVRLNPFIKQIMKGAILERVKRHNLLGVWIKVILDIEKGTAGADIKSTSCTTFNEFMKSAVKFNYFRQIWIYMTARKLKKFYIIGISKVHPHRIFIIDVSLFPDLLAAGAMKARLLIEIYQKLKLFYESLQET